MYADDARLFIYMVSVVMPMKKMLGDLKKSRNGLLFGSLK